MRRIADPYDASLKTEKGHPETERGTPSSFGEKKVTRLNRGSIRRRAGEFVCGQ